MHEAEKIPITDDFRTVLSAVGKGWAKPIKMHDRVPSLNRKYDLIKRYLPEYESLKSSVIDFSCGNGALIEIMRHYGNEVMGVEHYYLDYLRSQDLPFVEHNCDRLPYPFESGSYSLLTCVGSITFYEANWFSVLDEFFRIARDTVFIIANSGHILDNNKYILDNYMPDGWARVDFRDPAVYKWVRG